MAEIVHSLLETFRRQQRQRSNKVMHPIPQQIVSDSTDIQDNSDYIDNKNRQYAQSPQYARPAQNRQSQQYKQPQQYRQYTQPPEPVKYMEPVKYTNTTDIMQDLGFEELQREIQCALHNICLAEDYMIDQPNY